MRFQLSARGRLLAAILAASTLVACSGDDGSDGAIGSQGPQGNQGEKGEQGTPGSKGDTGDTGAQGPQGPQGPQGNNGEDGSDGAVGGQLTRLGTVPLGAEVTGAFVTEEGDLFFNVQHPSGVNSITDEDGKVFNTGTVGVVTGVNINQLPKTLISVPVPQTQQEQETVRLAYGEYQVIGQTGDKFGGALPQGLGTVLATDDSTIAVESNTPDFNGFLATGENQGYLFTNWESIPGGMSRLKLEKDSTSGRWSVDNNDVMMIDFEQWGTIANCFGSMSPWGTPLTSEEWGNSGDNTHLWNKGGSSQNAMAHYIDPTANNAGDADQFPNTYRYHYIVEIADAAGDNPTPVKHYTMGRFEHENSIVMPDERTVYLSQDDSGGVFFKFVADTRGDLSKGTLYAAKLTQDAGSSEPQTTGFDIEWIELAHSDNTTIDGWIAEYDAIGEDDYVEGKSSYLTDADAIAWARGDDKYPAYDVAYTPAVDAGYTAANSFGGQVTAGKDMDDRIAFLESRKAGRAKGATAEWQKFEGIYINQKRAEEAVEGTDLVPGEVVDQAYVYFAIADMDNRMIDGEGDIRLSNRVKECGGVYRMPLGEGYNVSRIEPVIMGATWRSGVSGAEQCDVDQLAQPDNVIVLDDGRIIIGEDGAQTNNTLWIYNPERK